MTSAVEKVFLIGLLFLRHGCKIAKTGEIVWCTISEEEQRKCRDLSDVAERKMIDFGDEYMPIRCVQGTGKENCMTLIDEEKADLISVDPGLVYIGSRHHSLVPILQEVDRNGKKQHYSVALIKRDSLKDVRTLIDLKGKKACFPAVGTLSGWFIPINTLMKSGQMAISDCNNHIKSATDFFGDSCAVNSLIDKYNPIGDNSDKLCRLCGGVGAGHRCTVRDPYYGYQGAVRCLIERGDVAFVKHTTVEDMTLHTENFQLLCKDGTRGSIGDYERCNWDKVPSNAIVTTTAKTPAQKELYQRFLQKLIRVTEGSQNRTQQKNLLLEDPTNTLEPITGTEQHFSAFLHGNLDHILGVRSCPIGTMTLCVSSEIELEKCVKMKTALNAQMLKPALNCFRTGSQIKCMEAIRNRIADVAVFDASDIHDAGKFHGLVPFMAEIYDLGKPEYYVVAVAREEDPSTDLTYLKNKYTCHTGVNMAAGWTIPLAVLISNGWIRDYGCDPIRSASEYFIKSCVPGALSLEYSGGRARDNLCDLCHSSTYRYCRRNPSEDYFGHTGAFRCLVEGGGEVAFVKHTTVFENTDGKKKDIWARNTFAGDFELLCVNGKRAEVKDYRNCSLGKVKSNAVVARGGKDYNETEVASFINLFSYAQQYYGRKNDDYLSFGLFSSPSPHSDIIFQDATNRLQAIPVSERDYRSYLGRDFLRAKKIVDCD